MKLLFTLFTVLLFGINANAQLKITEISYNPPESGTDSLEYVELHNTSDIAIDLSGYIIADNNMDTLTGGMVPAGGYIITASNVSAISDIFGISALSTPNIALRNGGERVAILDPQGNELDAVEFSPDAPWPTFMDGTAGEGASIELCNLEANGNDGANWRAADNDLGIMLNGKAIKGTPAAANTTTCDIQPDIVSTTGNVFIPADITINVGETVVWANEGGFHNINGSLAAYPNNPEPFSNGVPSPDSWTFEHTFTIPGVYGYRCDPHFTLNMVGTITVVGEPDPIFPMYDIATLTTNGADGVADSLGVAAAIEGVSYGTNFRVGGLQFTIIDANGDGMGVFSNAEDFGINYEEGMELRVNGTVTQFSGLTQIEVASIEVLSTGNTLIQPVEITALGEDTESQFVAPAGELTFVDPSAWGNGNTSGFNVEMTDGTNTYNLRIDNDSPLFTADIPITPAMVVGIGGQFDNSNPFTDGYQLAPRYESDFTPIVGTSDELAAEVTIYPNPVVDKLNIKTDVTIDQLQVTNALGQVILTTRGANRLDVSGLDTGVYYLRVTSDGKSKVVPFTR